MHFKPQLCDSSLQALLALWHYPQGEILDITAFGDLFIRENNRVIYISITDGTIEDVSELVAELGLPPVSLDLGDQWYQLSTQYELAEQGWQLNNEECFAFKTALFANGDYALENVQCRNIIAYHQQHQAQILCRE